MNDAFISKASNTCTNKYKIFYESNVSIFLAFNISFFMP